MVSEQAYITGQLIDMDTRSKAVELHMKKLDLEIADLGTVTSRLEAKLESTAQTLQVFGHKQEKIENGLLVMNQKYEELIARIDQMSVNLKMDQKNKGIEGFMSNLRSSSVLSFQESSVQELGNHVKGDNREEYKGNTRLSKIDFPTFGGEGPKEWLREARKYFQNNQTPDELRLGMVKKYFEGKAYVWFYGFIANHPEANWSLFSYELCKRFDENTWEEVCVERNTGLVVAHNKKMEIKEKLVGQDHGSHVEVAVVVEDLVKIGGNPIMVTGDNWRTSQVIAKEVGITYGRAEMIPTGQANAILSSQKSGKIVGEREFTATPIQLGDVFEVILDSKMLTEEYTVQNLIEENENRTPIDEEKFFEKELRPKDMTPDEDAIYEFEEEHNEAYVTLHYLLNPRMVKRMGRLLTSYKKAS